MLNHYIPGQPFRQKETETHDGQVLKPGLFYRALHQPQELYPDRHEKQPLRESINGSAPWSP